MHLFKFLLVCVYFIVISTIASQHDEHSRHAHSMDAMVDEESLDMCKGHSDLIHQLRHLDSTRRCVRNCRHRKDGDYQSCTSCSHYVSCSGGRLIDGRPCPGGLRWNDRRRACDYPRYSTTTCPEPGVPTYGWMEVDLARSMYPRGSASYTMVNALTGKRPYRKGHCSVPIVYTITLPRCTTVVSFVFEFDSHKSGVSEKIAFGVDDLELPGMAADPYEMGKSIISVKGDSIIISKNYTESGAVFRNENAGSKFCAKINPGQPIQISTPTLGNYQISGASYFDRTPKLNFALNFEQVFRQTESRGTCKLSVAWRCR